MNVTVIRKRRNKRMYLRVKDGEVVVTAPAFVSDQEIEAFVHSRSDWIALQLEKNRPLQTGDQLNILQETYTVIRDDKTYVDGHRLHLSDQKALQALILEKSEAYLRKRFADWQDRMGYADLTLKFGFYTSKWGSCQPAKRLIRLNGYLALCDPEGIDAVIVHELCHLKVLGHSQRFYREISKWLPDYKQAMASVKQIRIPRV